MTDSPVTPDRWDKLRSVTPARIALGRAGGSVPTQEWLKFKSAHAGARDAVHNLFHADELAAEIARIGIETVVVESAARDRMTFLQRPDLGRRLEENSRQRLRALAARGRAPAVGIIVSDGLSAL